MELSVLLVEDDPEDLKQFERDIPEIFQSRNISAHIDSKGTFEEAFAAVRNPHTRYDLVISDTYRGLHSEKDAAVLAMIAEYRKGRFAPIVVYSSAARPAALNSSVFVTWADKGKADDIRRAIEESLDIGIPQIARALHDEIDSAAGNFLWKFLEDNWTKLTTGVKVDRSQLERIIRRRVALKVSDLIPGSDSYAAVATRHGLEYYVYPCLEQNYFNLGDVIQAESKEFRVVLTPHCLLVARPTPKAEHVLTVKTVSAATVIGEERLALARKGNEQQKYKKLSSWAKNQVNRTPEGRYWYLPKFLEIPHLYCDFLQVECIEHGQLKGTFKRIATLTPPYAEALQERFAGFYGSVGIPEIEPRSISDLL